MENFSIELTNRAEKALKKLNSKDKPLLAEVYKKLGLLEKGTLEGLDIRPIVRKDGLYAIQEIRIRNPRSYRVFYWRISKSDNKILIVDGQEKKKRRFPSKYFKMLDHCIKEYYQGK